jgi:AcrR family transcriptional regulator
MSSGNLNTKNRILQAALDLLVDGAANGVRMSDIAKRAGVSRQAVYLHYENRATLLIAATKYLDDLKDSNARLLASRTASTGVQRLDAYIEAWGEYIPEIYGIAKALMAMSDMDEAAYAAWDDRMQAMREGCAAAIEALHRDNKLSAVFSTEQATDILWTQLSVRNWEQLTQHCGWTQAQYITAQKKLAHTCFVKA